MLSPPPLDFQRELVGKIDVERRTAKKKFPESKYHECFVGLALFGGRGGVGLTPFVAAVHAVVTHASKCSTHLALV